MEFGLVLKIPLEQFQGIRISVSVLFSMLLIAYCF